MKREDLLAKGYTEEQVTDLLNMFHGINKEKDKKIADLQSEVLQKSEFETKYNEANAKLEEINKANMTEQEKFEAMKKETENNYKQSKIIVNKAKAKEVLGGLNIDDSLIDTLVSEDENATIQRANLLKNTFTNYKDNVVKETKEAITTIDVKPSATNIPQRDDNAMNWERFSKMSSIEQEKFINEHPVEFENLK